MMTDKKKTIAKNPRSQSSVTEPITLPPQAFVMVRKSDETGISGTGVICEGTIYSNGKVTTCWTSQTPAVHVWDSFKAFKSVHIDPHPDNGTEIRYFSTEYAPRSQ